MNRFNVSGWVKTLAVMGILGLLAPAADAAVITWGSAMNITGSADVATVGTLNYAYDWNGTSGTVNSVPFAGTTTTTTVGGGNIALSSGWAGAQNTFLGPASYNNTLTGSIWAGSAGTVTVGNLLSGHQYAIQFWANDYRNSIGNRIETLAGTNGPRLGIRHVRDRRTRALCPGRLRLRRHEPGDRPDGHFRRLRADQRHPGPQHHGRVERQHQRQLGRRHDELRR